MKETVKQIQQEIKKAIVGKDDVVSKVLMAILASGHVLLEDVPGVGKTTMTLAFAKALGMETKRIQFTSDTMPSDIIGFSVYDHKLEKFAYKPGAIMTNMLLADEINRTSSKTQSALLEAMEEGRVTVDGETHSLPTPFVVLATQNPVGSAGTQLLPPSQLDRFLIKVSMGYPDFQNQVSILRDRHSENPLNNVSTVLTRKRLLDMIAGVTAIHVHDTIYEYITSLTEATRKHPMVQLGISPRGALALSRMTKACAFHSGRDYTVPEDVAAVFPDVCGHRLVLNSKARFNELDDSVILKEIIEDIPMPVLREIE